MIRPVAAGVFVACALAAIPAVGDEDPLAACIREPADMTFCILDQYDLADAELNRVVEQALATIRPTDALPADAAAAWREHLAAAQRAWVSLREEDCSEVTRYEWYGGSGANPAVATCLYRMTVARTDELRRRYPAGER